MIKLFFSILGYKVIKEDYKKRQFETIYQSNKTKTMIPLDLYIANMNIVDKYLSTIQGDIVECGVWRGGMIAGIAELSGGNRKFYLYDSFEGLPNAQEIDGIDALNWQNDKNSDFYFENCKAEMSHAIEAMEKTNVDFCIVKGWFNETLPISECQNIALLRLDADWYESTMSILENLYPKVVKNGIIIIDDYFTWDGCSRAVHDYLSRISSTSRIRELNGVCYLIKTESTALN